MIKTLQDYFATQPVLKAWVFGSFARGEETEDSEQEHPPRCYLQALSFRAYY